MRAAIVFCLLYGAVAIANRGNERFPFFSWDLFSTVPNPRNTDYSVRLIGAAGLPKTVYFEHTDLLPGPQETQGYHALQVLGKFLESGDTLKAAVVWANFESTYLSTVRDARYEVVKRVSDVRERVDCPDCFTTEDVIAEYNQG